MKFKSKKTSKAKDLWKNPSYRNMLNPYESKYPQKRSSSAIRRPSSDKKK